MLIGFRLLGPVELVAAGQAVDVGSPQRRAVLAALAVDAGRPVATDVLVERVWGDRPPESAARTLQAHITRLRRLLERSARPGQDLALLVRRSGGYALDVAADLVDLHRFRQLCVRAQCPGTTDGERAGLLRDALEIWRGQPLTGIPGGWADRVRATLVRQHVAAATAWARSEMRTGAVAGVVDPLSRLVATYPLSESLTATLMQALCLIGQKADALACYAAIRRGLVEELGVEPGHELGDLYRAVLNGDVDSAASPPGTGLGANGAGAAPSLLPLDIGDFTGREAELSHLLELLSTPPRASVAVGIWGRAGTGKTALAVHAAHRVRDRFPDGQVFLDLGGPAQPVPAHVAVSRALTALDIGRGRLPATVSDQVELYRAYLAVRRVLVVLDNAADERTVRPLMPVGPGCAVLITSRHRLAALESARWVGLSELDDATAVRLLTAIAGPEGVGDPGTCRVVARMCGRLPLAVRIAGAKLAANPHLSMDDLAGRLGREQQRLDELRVGDLDVRATLSTSYESMDDRARLGFRSLGQLDGIDFPAWVPAAVHGWSVSEAAGVLDRLVHRQLLDVSGRDAAGRPRYRLHDLLAVFARELDRDHAARTAPNPSRPAAVEPDALVRATTAWLRLVDTVERRMLRRPRPQGRTADDAPVACPLGWLPGQRALLASGEIDDTAVVWELGWSVVCSVVALSFELDAHLDDWRMTRDVARLAGRRVGDRLAGHEPGGQLRVVPGHEPPWAKLVAEFEHCTEIFARSGRRRWRVAAMTTLGNLYRAQGRYEEAEATLRHSVELSEEEQHIGWHVAAHFSLGSLQIVTDRLDEALSRFAACRGLLEYRPDPLWHAYLLRATGYAYQQHGHHRQAIPPLIECLPVFRRNADHTCEAHALLLIAGAQLGLCRPEEAVAAATSSRCLFRDDGNVRGEAMALRIAGRALGTGADMGAALDALANSLAAFVRIGDPVGAALTLRDRAAVHRLARNDRAAGADRRSATSLLTQLGLDRLAHETRSASAPRSG